LRYILAVKSQKWKKGRILKIENICSQISKVVIEWRKTFPYSSGRERACG
jgi:hypothetical protein